MAARVGPRHHCHHHYQPIVHSGGGTGARRAPAVAASYWHPVTSSDIYLVTSSEMAVSADEIYAPLHFPLRSRRLSLPHSLAAASSRTSLSSEGSKSVIVSYKCKQTTTGILTKKKKESYEGKFQRYITFETGHGKLFLDLRFKC